ncbi:MAG: hypothetical protein KKB91_14005 [Proteobacteria bacterium]|jgi:hypothetical protein|nr:hypothetical protein [Desulfocapsa sp.]MBU3943081.1 hypothetical protein [Pseudomonadota bacterium]MBU4042107.1 hypothetical protein [Pseudomonadota bacterium]MBU4168980.1 hypothetical protein [Pseudomonadota bacterium]MBU4234876.1 hypothetical protein [Pseudomonadota bacterium]
MLIENLIAQFVSIPEMEYNRHLQTWKSEVMTESQNEFKRRHSWFGFRKTDLYENIGHIANVPRIIAHSVQKKDLSKIITDEDSGFVLKEIYGHSGRQVKVLKRSEQTDSYFDLLHNECFSFEEISELYTATNSIIEESLFFEYEPIPIDFKVFCFNGVARVVLVVDRNLPKVGLVFYHVQENRLYPWNEIYLGRPDRLWDERCHLDSTTLKRIESAQVEAERLCAYLDVEGLLLSVDTYVPLSTPGKVYIGELTPRPGIVHGWWVRKEFLKYLFNLD